MCVNVIQLAVILRCMNRSILGNLHAGDIHGCVMCVISGLGNYGSLRTAIYCVECKQICTSECEYFKNMN